MEIPLTKEFESICGEIKSKSYSIDQWAEIESDDMFQAGDFCGGFDADEKEFCFSFHHQSGTEYWFQFDLSVAVNIANGVHQKILGRVAG